MHVIYVPVITLLTEKDFITAFRCLGYFLRTKKREETSSYGSTVDIPFLMCQAPVRRYNYCCFTCNWWLHSQACMFLQRGVPPTEAVDSNNNQPHIVMFIDSADNIFTTVFRRHWAVWTYSVADHKRCSIQPNCCSWHIKHVRVKDFYRFVQEYLLIVPNEVSSMPIYVPALSRSFTLVETGTCNSSMYA